MFAESKENRRLAELMKRHGIEPPEFFDAEADDYQEAARGEHRYAVWYGLMKAKFERAARYPWLPLAHDPPVPPE